MKDPQINAMQKSVTIDEKERNIMTTGQRQEKSPPELQDQKHSEVLAVQEEKHSFIQQISMKYQSCVR